MISKKLLVAGLLVAAGFTSVSFAAAKDTKAAAPAEKAAAAPAAKGIDADYKTIPEGVYVLDSSHASIVWKVWHLGFSHFAARFDKISGTAKIDAANPSKSGVVISVDAASADTGVAKLDEELDGADYFNATANPAITFTSTGYTVDGVNAEGKTTGKVTGLLSLRGVTKPVVLNVVFNGHGISPFGGGERVGFNGTATIKRSEFGMTKLVPMVSDEVELEISAEFTKAV